MATPDLRFPIFGTLASSNNRIWKEMCLKAAKGKMETRVAKMMNGIRMSVWSLGLKKRVAEQREEAAEAHAPSQGFPEDLRDLVLRFLGDELDRDPKPQHATTRAAALAKTWKEWGEKFAEDILVSMEKNNYFQCCFPRDPLAAEDFPSIAARPRALPWSINDDGTYMLNAWWTNVEMRETFQRFGYEVRDIGREHPANNQDPHQDPDGPVPFPLMVTVPKSAFSTERIQPDVNA